MAKNDNNFSGERMILIYNLIQWDKTSVVRMMGAFQFLMMVRFRHVSPDSARWKVGLDFDPLKFR